jgi:hypothetical protein
VISAAAKMMRPLNNQGAVYAKAEHATYLKQCCRKILHIVAYLPHARIVEPQTQLLLRNIRMQQ